MRNFDSMRNARAKGNVQTIRLGFVFDIAADATSDHRAILVSQKAYRRSLRFRSGISPHSAVGNLINSAGLTLMGYPDTSGAPSANLRR